MLYIYLALSPFQDKKSAIADLFGKDMVEDESHSIECFLDF